MERVSLGSNRVATGETRLLSLIFRSKWIWTGWFFFFFFFFLFTGPFPVCYDLVMGRQVGSYRTNTKGRRSEVKGGPYGSRVGRRKQKIKKNQEKNGQRTFSFRFHFDLELLGHEATKIKIRRAKAKRNFARSTDSTKASRSSTAVKKQKRKKTKLG